MTLKTTGAEVVKSADDDALLARILWREDAQRGQSLRIVRPMTPIERFLFRQDRLSPAMLRRVSVLAYLLIPVLIFLNTVVPRIPTIPYVAVLIVSALLLVVALIAGFWFFLGASMVDRLQENPLGAMKAPATPAPDWWAQRMDDVTPEAIRAYQWAYLSREVGEERAREGEVLRGKFTPAQQSYRALTLGLGYLSEHRKRLTELLGTESLTEDHLQEMRRVADTPSIPTKITSASVAHEVRDWARNA